MGVGERKFEAARTSQAIAGSFDCVRLAPHFAQDDNSGKEDNSGELDNSGEEGNSVEDNSVEEDDSGEVDRRRCCEMPHGC